MVDLRPLLHFHLMVTRSRPVDCAIIERMRADQYELELSLSLSPDSRRSDCPPFILHWRLLLARRGRRDADIDFCHCRCAGCSAKDVNLEDGERRLRLSGGDLLRQQQQECWR